MIRYPYELAELAGGLFRVEFPDFPMLRLFGRSHYSVRQKAALALNALVSIRIREGLEIPRPREAINSFELSDPVEFRLRLHWNMKSEGLGPSELAERLDLEPSTVANMIEGEAEDYDCQHAEAVACIGLNDQDGLPLTMIFGLPPHRESAELALLAV